MREADWSDGPWTILGFRKPQTFVETCRDKRHKFTFNRIFFGGSSFSVQLEGCVNHSVQAAADYLTQVRKGCVWDPEETEIGEKRNRNLMQNLVGLITVQSKYVNTSHEFVLKRY